MPVILGHHLGLLATAALVLVSPNYYGTFYLGWAELSNIPLQLWDTAGHLHDRAEAAGSPSRRWLARARDLSYYAFCPAFFVVRVLGFTAITCRCFFPDVLSVLASAAAAPVRPALRGFLVLGAAFNALMLFWFCEAAGNALGIFQSDSLGKG